VQLTVRIATALALLVGCASDAADVQPTVAPATLLATGLRELPVRPFAPQYPLWSDGAAKRRWIHLPGPIGAPWELPVGTKLWKEFSVDGAVVETRYMEHAEAGWLYATYDAGGGLVPDAGRRGARHDIPSKTDCVACHGNAASPVLGFTALQLSADRDPLAPHADPPPVGALDLTALVAEGYVVPQNPAPRIAAATPEERAARGYLMANCGGCHRTEGPLAALGMDLHGNAAETTIDRGARFTTATATVRIAPGAPEASVVVARMSSRTPVSQMPPLGTKVVDREAVELVRRWITQLTNQRRKV